MRWKPKDHRLTKDELLVRLRKINQRCTDDLDFLEAYADTLQGADVELVKLIQRKKVAIATQLLYIQELERR